MNHSSQMGVHQQQHNPSYNSNSNYNDNTAAPPPPPPPAAAAPEVHHCLWDECQRVAPDAETLYLHLCNDHIGRKSTQNLCLTCHWKGCEISCAKRDHITSHLRVHTPLKPHGCPVCSKTFKRPQDLKKHERIHTQEHHSAHKHSKAAVSEDPEFADRVLAGTAPAEKKLSSGLLVPRGRAARESFSSSGSREGSTPEFASPKSNSLSPHSFSSHSDPLTTPPPDHFLPYPQLSTSQSSNDFGPHNTLLQNPYALQNNMYTLAGGGGYPNQPHPNHHQVNQYPGQQSWEGGAQTGQKREYDLGGFFDEVKKRKVEPTYDHEMARRLEEMTRGLATVGSGGISPGDGNPSPLPTHFNPLPSPSHHQLPHHSSIPNNISFPNLGQPNFLDQFNSSGPLPDFHNETEVAQTNSFLFNLLMGATAQQQNLRGGSTSFNGSDGSRSNGDQQQQHQQSNAPPIFDANVLAQMGLAGMPGLDPSVLFGSMQLQQQFQLQQQQQQQIRELQDQLALQQRMGQQGVNFGSNVALYPNLHDPINNNNNNNQAQQQFSRRTSVPNSGSSSAYGTTPVSLSNRPIAQLPTGNGRSNSIASLSSFPPNPGMQTLFTGNTPQLPTPSSGIPTFDSTAPSPANSHASSSHYSSSSSEIFSFNEASDPESSQASQFGRNGSHGAYHQHPSPGFSASFDSLARSRGPTIQTGLAPVNLWANTYRMMEPLSSAAPMESNERGSGGAEEEEEEEDEQVVMSSPKGLGNVDEEDEELHSPSDVAMKGPHRSQTSSSSSSSSEEILSSSPPLPSTLIASSSLKDFDPELKLPSINASYSLSHFRTSSHHQESASPTPSSPSSSHSHSTTRPTTPTNGTTLPPISALYPDLARPWSADELAKGVHGISGLGGAAERESKAKEAERHVELIKALLIAVNDKWRKTVALQAQASQVKVEVKVEEAEMMRVGGGEGLTA